MTSLNKYLIVIMGASLLILFSYSLYVINQRDNLKKELNIANKSIVSLNANIEKIKQDQKTVNDLDKEYQEKLQHAKTENDKLRNDLINNVKRVYVKADCPALPNTPTATSSINATTPRLTGDARQDYLRLRLEIKQVTNQVEGLQSYINNVCLKR